MKQFDLVFAAGNGACRSPKKITLTVCRPDVMNEHTGIMMFCHGWGCNRFQHLDKMHYTCDRHNLICFTTEYRMSGYDFDPVSGAGWNVPYDLSFAQTFDCLNALRRILELFPAADRGRLFAYGGSQGGHIVLLSAVFAPATFAFVYVSSPLTHVPDAGEPCAGLAGRDFSPRELACRNVLEHTRNILCPVYLESGTCDEAVPHDRHSLLLEKRLREQGHAVTAKYYEGGNHQLEPVIRKIDAYKAMIPDVLDTAENPRTDDFAAGSVVDVSCADHLLRIDWREEIPSEKLYTFIPAGNR